MRQVRGKRVDVRPNWKERPGMPENWLGSLGLGRMNGGTFVTGQQFAERRAGEPAPDLATTSSAMAPN
jgi:hypothetical protein